MDYFSLCEADNYLGLEKALQNGVVTPSIDLTGFSVGEKKLSFEVNDGPISLERKSGDGKNPKLEKDPA